ncbi:MAG: class IV adenylate cyclase [Acidobacteria bacterium]|nr:class IV adenylate cyclase [Acidobacteriota bacterium]
MKLETEVKIRVDVSEFERLRKLLVSLGAHCIVPRQLEQNLLFDFEDCLLKQQGCALRLRTYNGESRLTFKGKAAYHQLLKQRVEYETRVDEPQAMQNIFRELGLMVAFEYSKYREIFQVTPLGADVYVCFDETPFGGFVEIEGSEESINELARLLGWGPSSYVGQTYVEIYRRGREGQD